jgi:TusA-related sulfurtransferase
MPIVMVAKAIRSLRAGETVVVRATDRAFPDDIAAWCTKTGNALLAVQSKSGYFEAEVRCGR